MKTLLLVPELFANEGGIARIMRLYLKACAEQVQPGDTLGYLALIDRPADAARLGETVGTVPVTAMGCGRSLLCFSARAWWAGLRADRVLCGHVHHLILARLGRVFRPSLRYYLVAHGIEVWRPFSLMERVALRSAERIFCVSDYSRRQILRFLPDLDPARLVVIPNTFDPRFEPRSRSLSTGASQVSGAPRILVVSRLLKSDPYKGVDLMIEAMPLILQRYPGARLRIVGGGTDRPRLDALVRETGVGRAVEFTGIIDDRQLHDEYEACDIFALPSRKEGFGLVYLEAMNLGKPCLAARAGGAPEVVNAEVGALVEYGHVDQIALAVEELLTHPRPPEAMRRRAAEFGFPAFAERLRAAFH